MTNAELIQIIGLVLQFAGFAVIIIVFVVQNNINKRVLKQEIYQKLEFASIEMFRFELQNSASSWKLYDENHQIPSKTSKEYREMVNHVTQVLNLFEMSIEFRNKKIIENKIFASWIVWFWEMTQLKNFVILWKDIELHYMDELRFILRTGIASDGNWNLFIENLNVKYKCRYIADLAHKDSAEEKSNQTINEIAFCWGSPANLNTLDELVNLFTNNINNNYISHGEVIDGRANSLSEWKINLSDILKNELINALTNEGTKDEFNKLALCKLNNQIIGFAIIEFNRITNISILSDIIINNTHRGKNIGKAFISWLEHELKSSNMKMIFLESGIKNSSAHHFFEKSGYKRSSIVMVKEI
jgi:N-acetylglutamate synthase-like GNAT family acetyltransferase